jgi:hypothetical protein
MKKNNNNINYSFLLNEWKIPNIIEGEARKKKQIIYGAQAMNKQLPLFFHRHTTDYDILTKKPKETANQMQRRLDKEVAGGRDEFYYKQAKHSGTYKVRHIGEDKRRETKDDITIVDYTQMPKERVQTRRIEGIKYQTIPAMAKRKREILKDKANKYRWEKDREDLERIKYTKVYRGRYNGR